MVAGGAGGQRQGRARRGPPAQDHRGPHSIRKEFHLENFLAIQFTTQHVID